jgi:hypothetical protein
MKKSVLISCFCFLLAPFLWSQESASLLFNGGYHIFPNSSSLEKWDDINKKRSQETVDNLPGLSYEVEYVRSTGFTLGNVNFSAGFGLGGYRGTKESSLEVPSTSTKVSTKMGVSVFYGRVSLKVDYPVGRHVIPFCEAGIGNYWWDRFDQIEMRDLATDRLTGGGFYDSTSGRRSGLEIAPHMALGILLNVSDTVTIALQDKFSNIPIDVDYFDYAVNEQRKAVLDIGGHNFMLGLRVSL